MCFFLSDMYKFHISLYKNKSDSNVINKTLTNETPITGISRTAINLLQPVITVTNFNVNQFNYCYVNELMRYYYITQSIINPDNTITINLRVDVLKTYEADILASKGLITKQRAYNPYYGDFAVDDTFEEKRYNFDNVFTENGDFILVALRG